MSLLGRALLLIAFAAALVGVAAAIVGYRRRDLSWQRSAERAVYATFAAVAGAAVVFEYALLTDDFSLKFVAEYSSRDMPTHFKVTSLWASQAGSLMLSLLLFTGVSAAAVAINRHRNRELMPVVVAVLMIIAAFFASMVNFITSPFETVIAPADGTGLNPLLQNEYMVAHPPMLYVGYVSLAIPFAFAVAALVTRRLDTAWIVSTRRWIVFAWLFLGFGILLGAQWAYHELGWGGYWFWDAVENAALMPWLVATAFLHSIMVQERRGMLKVWNILLVCLTFMLALFGTFLTRSGIVVSIHAFGERTLGPYFLGFIVLAVVATLVLIFMRLDDLRSTHSLESYVSREAVFLYNNLLLVGLAFAVFWGTMFPVFTEVLRGDRIAVGAPFFDQVALPIGLALLILTGVGPLIPWRAASVPRLVRAFAPPVAVALVAGVLMAVLTDAWTSVWGGATLTACVFVLACILGEFVKGTRVRHSVGDVSWPGALVSLVGRNRRRYGGYLVHVGVVVLFVGLAGSSAYSTARDVTLRPGDSTTVAGYTFTASGFTREADSHVRSVAMTLSVTDPDGASLGTVHPAKNIYVASMQPSTEVALKSMPTRDLYVALVTLAEDGTAQLSIYVTPLVSWIWMSGLVMIAGTLLAAWPSRRRRPPPAAPTDAPFETTSGRA